MTAIEIAHQYFADLAAEGENDIGENLRAWLWFTCPAHMRAEVEVEIQKIREDAES